MKFKRALITAGPTREFFDPVRFISNPSSGKMGYAVAQAALDLGMEVELVSGPVALAAPKGARLTRVVTGAEMLAAVSARFARCDLLVKTAAVCDFRPKRFFPQKMKKEEAETTVEFERVPDILKTVAQGRLPHQCLVGFAAETRDVEAYARRKLREKNLDFVAANRVGGGAGFESDENEIFLFSVGGETRRLGPAPKTEIARMLLEAVEELYHG